MKTKSQQFIRKRRFAMVMPVLALPFVIAIFWALGGGSGTNEKAVNSEIKGLNAMLPDAAFNDEEWNKLALYDRAQRDSLKLKEQQQSDPYVELPSVSNTQESNVLQSGIPVRSIPSNVTSKPYVDPNEARVNQKLDELYRELDSNNSSKAITATENKTNDSNPSQISADVQKLEEMMEMMKSDNAEDPEMKEIGGMLDKILDIQHPDRVRERLMGEGELRKGVVFPVDVPPTNMEVGLLSSAVDHVDDSLTTTESSRVSLGNSFFGIDDIESSHDASNAIKAVVHDDQEIVNGSTVKLRLLQEVFINGRLIPTNQFVFGIASINDERLTINITSIREENSLLPVSLSAYDLDGLPGIYIPGAITRDVAKQSSDQAMQSLQFMSMDQSLGAQAASAGIQAAKGLFSKKVKLVKVTVKAGYQVLLRDQNDRS